MATPSLIPLRAYVVDFPLFPIVNECTATCVVEACVSDGGGPRVPPCSEVVYRQEMLWTRRKTPPFCWLGSLRGSPSLSKKAEP